jgi:hypothetical protein
MLLARDAVCAQSNPDATSAPASGANYITGGVGLGERAQFKGREKDFNLKIASTLYEGNYVSDVDVAVKDASGKSVLALTTQGPLVLAKLPRGSYVVQAAYDGKVQTRKITLGDRLQTVFFRWRSNPKNEDFPGPRPGR